MDTTDAIVTIIYTNWKGETTERSIRPIEIWYGSTQWHADKQWLLKALDVKKNENRDFAIKDIKNWSDSSATTPGVLH